MHLKVSSAKWRPFCLGLNVLSAWTFAGPVMTKFWSCIYYTWWRHQMEIFSALLALCVGNSLATGEFPAQRPVTRSFDVFFDLRLNKLLSKQLWGWWFEMPSRSWFHCNDRTIIWWASRLQCTMWSNIIYYICYRTKLMFDMGELWQSSKQDLKLAGPKHNFAKIYIW